MTSLELVSSSLGSTALEGLPPLQDEESGVALSRMTMVGSCCRLRLEMVAPVNND